jgi:hypothetical protein
VDLGTGAATLVGAIGGNPPLRGIAVFESPVLLAFPAAATAIGLRGDNTLIRFPVSAPASAPVAVAVTGLNAGDTLIGIDYRPNGGALYGIAGSGNLYTINPASGVATVQATLSVALSGTRFAVDFNPPPIACAWSATAGRIFASMSWTARPRWTVRSIQPVHKSRRSATPTASPARRRQPFSTSMP